MSRSPHFLEIFNVQVSNLILAAKVHTPPYHPKSEWRVSSTSKVPNGTRYRKVPHEYQGSVLHE